jgi:hypothetical protein
MGTGHGLLCMSLKENTDEAVFGDLSQEWSYFRGFGSNPFMKLADVGPIVNHVKAGCSIGGYGFPTEKLYGVGICVPRHNAYLPAILF